MTATQSSFFLTEVESSLSSFSSHLSFHDICKSISVDNEDKLDLIYLDLQHLLEEDGAIQPTSQPCSPSTRHARISHILAELNELARWTNAQDCLDTPGPPLPWLFCNINLKDWQSTQPKTITLEYTLFLWTAGYLDSPPVSNITYSERINRSDLVRNFQQSLDRLLSLTSYITSRKPNPKNLPLKKPYIANKSSGVILDDIELEFMLSSSHASKQRKWYFIDKCYQHPHQLLSQSMPLLPQLRTDHPPSSAKDAKKKGQRCQPTVKSEVSREALKGIETALFAGDALGTLCVRFVMTTSKNKYQCKIINF